MIEEILLEKIGDIEVEITVVVVVSEGGGGAVVLAVVNAGARGHVGESAIAPIVI
ncbi:MAG: trypco2 family protein [Candidatus Latescibacterota bacterium]